MLCQLTAAEARSQIAEGRLTSVDLVKACLDRIMETDRDIGAWAHVDAMGALEQAEQLDTIRRKGNALGALHGVPVGLKDIFDVKGLPTECGMLASNSASGSPSSSGPGHSAFTNTGICSVANRSATRTGAARWVPITDDMA